MKARRGERRIAPPLISCCAQFRQSLPEDAGEQDDEDDRADRDHDHQPGVIGEEAELDREGAADGEEEVEVEARR